VNESTQFQVFQQTLLTEDVTISIYEGTINLGTDQYGN